MSILRKQLDQFLLDLAWSLWTELGVLGVKQNHHSVLISIEELVVLTAVLAEVDPRLRDESLDWCSQYHRLVSISRLKSIVKDMENSIQTAFSIYSASLNTLVGTNWPLFTNSSPLKISLSHKSCLRPLESPALLNVRARSLFTTGARADLATFFLTHKQSDFAISDLKELGYSKRNLAEILDEFSSSGLFEKSQLRNQLRYRLAKKDQLAAILSPIPTYAPSWIHVLKVLLSLRQCIKRNEKTSESTLLVEIRNLLISIQEQLQSLKLSPPGFQGNTNSYLTAFAEWLLNVSALLAQGKFPNSSFLKGFN